MEKGVNDDFSLKTKLLQNSSMFFYGIASDQFLAEDKLVIL